MKSMLTNLQLCRVLGIDPSYVTSITITATGGERYPEVTTTHRLPGDKVPTVQKFRLVSIEGDDVESEGGEL